MTLPLTPQQKAKFLAKLKSAAGNASKAAHAAGISRNGAYQIKEKDPDFAAAWDEVLASVYDEMEQELYRRAVIGFKDKDGIKRKSDRLLEFALKGNRAEKFRERFEINNNISGSLDVNIEAAIKQIYGNNDGTADPQTESIDGDVDADQPGEE